jgi:histone-binding protein RBBP4
MMLTGHTDYAEFAMGCSSVEPMVASGGRDKNVVIWNLKDHVSSTLSSAAQSAASSPSLAARYHLSGHEDVIEDVCWQPGSAEQLASVGDDQKLLLWDLRTNKPSHVVNKAHGATDLHCVDWCALDSNMLATACAKGWLKVWDTRKLQVVSGHPASRSAVVV